MQPRKDTSTHSQRSNVPRETRKAENRKADEKRENGKSERKEAENEKKKELTREGGRMKEGES